MSKILKAAIAASLALPLVAVAGGAANAFTYPAENDCTQPFGAVTTQPGPVYGAYGIDNGPGDGDSQFGDDCTGGTGDFGRGRTPRAQGATGDAYLVGIAAGTLGDVLCDAGDTATGFNIPNPGVGTLIFTGTQAMGVRITTAVPANTLGLLNCIDTARPSRPTTGP